MTLDIETVSCPVCGVAPFTIFWKSAGATRYICCASCGLVYASPRASHKSRYAWLDESFTVTPGLLSQLDGRKPALKLEAEFIKKYILRGRMLDVGCSIGDFFAYFNSPEWELHGVELAESAAQFSSKKYSSKVYCGTLQAAAYPNHFFDLVTMIDTLYYVDDPALEIAEISRITRPNGFVAIEIAGQAYALWRNYGWAARFFDNRETRADSDSSYLYWFNYKALKKLLHSAGFEIVNCAVIPSPASSSPKVRMLTRSHFSLMRALGKISTAFLDASPKWMVLARKEGAFYES